MLLNGASVWPMLGVSFGLGLLHALDADHIMAVTGLSSTRPGVRTSLRFCARWAIGHGLTLLAIGSAVLLLGMAIPATLSRYAEHFVGFVLVAIGAWVLWDVFRNNKHLHFHQHAGLPRHAHWHTHSPRTRFFADPSHAGHRHAHNHSAVLVGIVHGTAGSAPLLALIPMTQLGTPWYGMAYLLVFGLGVLAAMMVFGGMLGGAFTWLSGRGARVLRATRVLAALSSAGFGLHLLHGVFA